MRKLVFPKKNDNLRNSKVDYKTLCFLVETVQQVCQNCLQRLQKSFFGVFLESFPMNVLGLWPNYFENLDRSLLACFQNLFWVSGGTIWGNTCFFEKKFNFLVFVKDFPGNFRTFRKKLSTTWWKLHPFSQWDFLVFLSIHFLKNVFTKWGSFLGLFFKKIQFGG